MDVLACINSSLVMDAPAQQRVAESFFQWLAGEATKKPVPDLAERLTGMQAKLRIMAAGLKVEMVMGAPVVSASGDSHSTWCLLKRGSSWFEPHPHPELVVLVAVMS